MNTCPIDPSPRREAFSRIAVGLAFILFPLVYILAFAVHPGLLSPHFLGPLELIERSHGNGLLHFAHALVTLNTGLMVVAALALKRRLDQGGAAWAGLAGAALAIFGALMLAADKGALCLSMSALDTLPEAQFEQFLPGLQALFAKAGWLALLWGLLALPLGFLVLAGGMLRVGALKPWQAAVFMAGLLFVGLPDGAEIVNLSAAVLIAIVMVPYGLAIIRRRVVA